MSDTTIYQLTDLAQNRVQFVEAARQGCARLRDKDGTSLVMLPERELQLLEQLARWNNAHLRLEKLVDQGRRPSVSELGEMAWLRVFDLDELREFVAELQEVLVAAHADRSLATLDACIHAWRVTASQLNDPLRRAVLHGSIGAEDLVEAARPDSQ